jgi:hypothetical protein
MMFPGFREVSMFDFMPRRTGRRASSRTRSVSASQESYGAAAVVEDLDVLDDRVRELDSILHLRRSSSSTCIRAQNDSTTASMERSPIEPIEATSPESRARLVDAHEVN